mmetsp:Transcript_4420/g.5905  ORF Transcript_4420/g.5905 Transcript_4420/m.5905 type:complete len:226 (-) Transcript_4420:501-1178(-)
MTASPPPRPRSHYHHPPSRHHRRLFRRYAHRDIAFARPCGHAASRISARGPHCSDPQPHPHKRTCHRRSNRPHHHLLLRPLPSRWLSAQGEQQRRQLPAHSLGCPIELNRRQLRPHLPPRRRAHSHSLPDCLPRRFQFLLLPFPRLRGLQLSRWLEPHFRSSDGWGVGCRPRVGSWPSYCSIAPWRLPGASGPPHLPHPLKSIALLQSGLAGPPTDLGCRSHLQR